MEYMETTYRSIAKAMASHSGAQDEEYGELVNEMLEVILKLDSGAKYALKCAFVFSRKAPREEREDLMQELFLNVYKSKAQDEKLCYAIARCDWKDWWKQYKVRSHYSLDESVSQDERGNPETIGDLLVNEIRFETMVDGKLDAEYLWAKLPASVKPIITKRLQSKALTACERKRLNRFVHTRGTSPQIYVGEH
jgi:hypothetical protein